MKKLAAYCRVSTGRQEKEQTIEVQETFIKEWALKNDVTIIDWYKDDGWSGELLARPELDRLRDDAKKNLWDGIIFIDRDRLARKLSLQELIIDELQEIEKELIFLNEPLAKSPEGRIMQQIKGVFAEYERAKITERMRRGKIHKAKSGKIVGNEAPYGYKYILKVGDEDGYYVVSEPEAEIAKMIFHWVADDGYSAYRVVQELYKRKITPPKGKNDHWSKSTVIRLLNRKDYIGTGYYNKSTSVMPKHPQTVGKYKKIKKSSRKGRPQEDWIAIPTPAIIDEDLFYRAKQKMRENFLYGKRNKHYSYLLTGKVMCLCGSKRVGDGVNGHHYYRCAQRIYKFPLPNKCNYEGVNAEVLDQMVWNKMLSLLGHPEVIKPQVIKWQKKRSELTNKSQEQKNHIESAIKKLAAEEDRYTEAFGAGLIDFEKFKSLVNEVKNKKKVIGSQKNEIIEEPVSEKDVLGDFDTLCRNVLYALQYSSVADKQRDLRSLIDSIYVGERNKAVVNGRIPVILQPQNIQYESISRHCWSSQCWKVYLI